MQKARQSIIRVIEDFGYEPMLIDIKEHNNQIVPELFSHIDGADFVISDLTEQKNGHPCARCSWPVQEKQVILSCKADDFEKNHFDVKQINTIRWENEEELENKLRTRIKAMHLDNF